MDSVVGIRFLKILQIPPEGLPVVTQLGNVQVNPGQVSTHPFILSSQPPAHGSWDAPVINSIRMEWENTGNTTPDGQAIKIPVIVLTGDRFTYNDPMAPSNRNAGSQPTDAMVQFIVPGLAQPIFTTPLPTSTNTELRVQVPQAVTLGVAGISVIRPQYIRGNGSYNTLGQKESEPVRMDFSDPSVTPPYVFVALGGNQVATVNRLTNQSVARIPIAQGSAFVSTRSVAVTPDGTRAYVSLRFGHDIALIDAITLQEVDADPATPDIDHIKLPYDAQPFWLTIDPRGEYLYASDELTGRIYAINIDPSPLFGAGDIKDLPSLIAKLDSQSIQSTELLSEFIWDKIDQTRKQVLTGSGSTEQEQRSALLGALNKIIQGEPIYTPERFYGVQLRPETAALLGQNPHGEQLVRLNRLLLEDAYAAELENDYHQVKVINLPGVPNGLRGMDINSDGRRLYAAAPAAEVPGSQIPPSAGYIHVVDVDPLSPTFQTQLPNGVILADSEPYGVTATSDPLTITFTNRRADPQGFGVIQSNADQTAWSVVQYAGLELGPVNDYFDVNNAQGIAILPDKSYAFVTGFDRFVQGVPSRDPDYDPQHPGGGNIGIIKDPLGLNGLPKLVGATRPTPLSFPDNLVLSPDGQFLYAGYSGNGAVFVYSVPALLQELNYPANSALLNGYTVLDRFPVDDLVQGVHVPNLAIDIRADYRLVGTGNSAVFRVPPGSTQGPIGTGGQARGLAVQEDRFDPLRINGPDQIRLTTKVDRINGTVCDEATPFTFSVNLRAKVTLLLDGQVAVNVANPLDGGLTQLSQFKDIILDPGVYTIFLLPIGQLAAPGDHTYQLSGVDVDHEHNTASDSGDIGHEIEINASLPIGHTIVKGVDIWDGHLTLASDDAVISGRGLSLDFSRTYSSAGSSSESPLGAGWTHSYNVRLVRDDSCGTLTVIGGEGSGNAFNIASAYTDPQMAALWGLPSGAKFYKPQVGFHSTLVQPDPQGNPGSFDFYTKSHNLYHFELDDPISHSYQLKFIEEPNGNRVNLYYDQNDARWNTLPVSLQSQFDTDSSTLDAVVDSSGRGFVFAYSDIALSKRIIDLRGYSSDPTNFMLDDLHIHYGYDVFGNLTDVIRSGDLPSDTREEKYDYVSGIFDAGSHNLTGYTDANGNKTEYKYYSLAAGPALPMPGYSASFGVLPFEFVKQVIEPETQNELTQGVQTHLTAFTYNIAANTRVVTDQRTNVEPTNYTLNTYGATVKIEEPLGKTTLMEWATPDTPRPDAIPGSGIDVLMVSKTDALGQKTSYQYDSQGNIIKETVDFSQMAATGHLQPVINGNGAAVNSVSTYFTYDPTFNKITSKTDSEGRTTIFVLDISSPGHKGTGNLLSILDAENDLTRYFYAAGSGNNYGPGDLTMTIDPLGKITQYLAYDAFGNATLIEDAEGNKTTQVFDVRSRLIERSDTFGHHAKFDYDKLDRVVHQEQIDDIYHLTSQSMDYVFTPHGELRYVTDGLGQITEYRYDALNRKTRTIEHGIIQGNGPAVDLVTVMQYDPVGNLVQSKDTNNILQQYAYDDLNRRIETRILGGPSPTLVGVGSRQVIQTAGYDLVGNKLFEKNLHNDTIDYVYDGLYRVVSTQLPFYNTFGDVPSGGGRAHLDTRYDLVGHKLRETDANGNATTYEYDKIYRLTRKTDADNNVTESVYDRSSNLVRQTRLSNGIVTSLITYDNGSEIADGLNRPSFIHETVFLGDPADSSTPSVIYTTAYDYEDTQNIIRVTDPRGFTAEQQRDGLDRIYQSIVDVHGLALATTFSYDANGNQKTVRDPQNGDTDVTYTYDGLNRKIKAEYLLGLEEKFAYDGDNNLIRYTDKRGIVFTNDYDNLNRILHKNVIESITNGSHLTALSAYEYHDAAHYTIETDANGNDTKRQFDGLGRTVQLTDTYGFSTFSTYDGVNLRTGTDKKGQRNEYRYDSLNRHIETREFDASNILQSTLSTQYEDEHNRVILTDRMGIETIQQNDSRGRLVQLSRKHPDLSASYGSAEVTLEQYEYDGNNNETLFRDAQGNEIQYVYDAIDRMTFMTEGFGSPVAATTSYTYDNVGNLLTIKDGRPHGGSFDVQYTYDARYRKLTGTNAEGETTRYTKYDGNGNLLEMTEPLGAGYLTIYAYDELGALLSVDQLRGGAGGTTFYVYDANRNKIAQQDANGNLNTYQYDKLNRLTDTFQHFAAGTITPFTQRTGSVGGNQATALHWQYGYDVNNNQILLIDAMRQQMDIAYDYLDRLETTVYSHHSDPTLDFQIHSADYDYDANSNLVGRAEVKRGINGANVTEIYHFDYDKLDRLQQSVNYDGKSIAYTYDKQGNRKSVTDPDGRTTTYVYDGRNRLSTATTESGMTTYTYWQNNLLKSIEYPNHAVADYSYANSYDKAGRLTFLSNHFGAVGSVAGTSDPAFISSFAYTYDANSNRLTQSEAHHDINGGNPETTVYGYDLLNRLTHVAYGLNGVNGETSYTYQKNGNRATETGRDPVDPSQIIDRTYAYDRVNQLRAIVNNADPTHSIAYDYDDNGNRISKATGQVSVIATPSGNPVTVILNPVETITYQYDIRDELLRTPDLNGGFVTFDYDANGMRVKKISPTDETRYLYDGKSTLIEYDGALNTTIKYDYGYSLLSLIDIDPSTQIRTAQFYHYDGLGSTVELTNLTGGIQKSYLYDAWGDIREKDGAGNSLVAGLSVNAKEYTGHYYDSETDLHYFGARYYDDATGFFITQDSYLGDINNPPSLHRYLFAYSNPLHYADADGHFANILIGAGIGAAVGGIAAAIHGEDWEGIAKAAGVGAVAGAVAGATFGASLALTAAAGIGGVGGSALIAGTVAGAAGGFVGGAGGSLANGGTVQEAYEQGTVGAFTGAVGGALTAPLSAAGGTVGNRVAGVAGKSAGEFASGFVAGAGGDLAGQVALNTGAVALGGDWQGIDWTSAALSGGVGGSLGIIEGRYKNQQSRQTVSEDNMSGGTVALDDLANEQAPKNQHSPFHELSDAEISNYIDTEINNAQKPFSNEPWGNEIDAAIDNARSSVLHEYPGQSPNNPNIGLQDIVTRENAINPDQIWLHTNHEINDVAGAPGNRSVEARAHTSNPNAPAGSYSANHPTVQINRGRNYFAPDFNAGETVLILGKETQVVRPQGGIDPVTHNPTQHGEWGNLNNWRNNNRNDLIERAHIPTEPEQKGSLVGNNLDSINLTDGLTENLIKLNIDYWISELHFSKSFQLTLILNDFIGSQLGEAHISKFDSTGQISSGIIELDTNAAGLGWFIGNVQNYETATAANQSKSNIESLGNLPVSDKYDLYTVFNHELGHLFGFSSENPQFNSHVQALADGSKVFTGDGFTVQLTPDGDHIADPNYANDLMSETLDPGVRRLPSQMDRQVLQTLYGTVNASGIQLAAATSVSTLSSADAAGLSSENPVVEAGSNEVIQTTLATVQAVALAMTQGFSSPTGVSIQGAAEPINGDFSIANPAATDFGWTVQGQASVQSGQMVLHEDAIMQTRVSQNFDIPGGATQLSFTLVNGHFDTPLSGPQDAFEVALLDEATGAPLAGKASLSGTDALFNLQADSQFYKSSTVNLSGMTGNSLPSDFTQPITVSIDLTGIQAGQSATLYFDLLGFGALGSSVTLDDVRFVKAGGNQAPAAVNDTYTLDEDQTMNLPVLANDSGLNGNALTPVLVAAPAHGLLTLNPDNSFTYKPIKDFNGADSFTYKVNDGSLDSNVATVNLTINAVNDAPVVNGIINLGVIDQDSVGLTLTAAELLAKASDVDGDTLSVVNLSLFDPSTGTLTVQGQGLWTYVPAANYHGETAFTYSVSDGQGGLTAATAQLTVISVNDAPALTSVPATLMAGTEDVLYPVNGSDLLQGWTDADGDQLAVVNLTADHGSVTDHHDGSYTVTPAADYNGPMALSYGVSDNVATVAASLDYVITPVNDAPVVTGPVLLGTLDEDTARTVTLIELLAASSDAEHDPLQVQDLQLADPAQGVLQQQTNGDWQFVPATHFQGVVTFAYTVSDGHGGLVSAGAQLTVLAANQAPAWNLLANPAIAEGSLLTVTLKANDPDNDALSYSLDTAPNGAAIDPQTGVFTWTPADGPAQATVRVRAIDTGGLFATADFQIDVTNVAPTLTVTGNTTALGGQAYTLNLSATDPGQDTISSWQVNWGDGAPQTINGNPSSVQHSYGLTGGNFAIQAQATDEDGSYQAGTVAVQVTPVLPETLKVTDFTPTASGFKVRFDHAFDPSVINLYDAADQTMGAADVTLQGNLMGVIKGSLVIDSDQAGFSFIRSGGLLAPDTYQVVLASGATAFHASVGALDGNGDGTPGDAYTTTFTATAPGSGYLSLPGFMRGPGQPVDVPATAQGLPVTFQSPGNVSSLIFTVGYNPAYLSITGATTGTSLPADAIIAIDLSQSGLARFTIVSPNTPLADGKLNLLNLIARVPDSARYGAKEIIDLTLLNVNSNDIIPSLDDDALHVVGYFGDASGNAQYTTLDVERIQRLVVKLDSGFSAWSQVDPFIIADINASGGITSKDAAYVYQELSGNDRPEIPALPPGIGPIVFNGPDPLASVPQNLTAQAGSRITVPVNLDIAAGLESVQLSLNYDDSALQLLTVSRGSLTRDFQWFVEKRGNGTVSVDLSTLHTLDAGQGSLIELSFKVLDAASGPIALDLQSATLNDGWLTLNPAPQPGNDPTDGLIVVDQPIAQPLPRTPVVMASLTGAAQQPALSEAQPEAQPAMLPPEASTQAKPFIGPNLPLPPDAMPGARNKRNPDSMPIVIDLDSAWDDGKRGDNTGKRAKANRWQAAFVKEGTATQQNPNLDIRITAESLPTGSPKERM